MLLELQHRDPPTKAAVSHAAGAGPGGNAAQRPAPTLGHIAGGGEQSEAASSPRCSRLPLFSSLARISLIRLSCSSASRFRSRSAYVGVTRTRVRRASPNPWLRSRTTHQAGLALHQLVTARAGQKPEGGILLVF